MKSQMKTGVCSYCQTGNIQVKHGILTSHTICNKEFGPECEGSLTVPEYIDGQQNKHQSEEYLSGYKLDR